MGRPRHCHYIAREPRARFFKPCGVPLRALEYVCLTVEGLEALRLSDLLGLTSSEAADRVRVSRFTYARTLAAARRAVAEALVTGRALRIEGGSYAFQDGKEKVEESCVPSSVIIAISSEGPGLDDQVDPRYGRAGGFVLAEYVKESDAPLISYLDNGDAQLLAQGLGIATTEHLVQAGVSVLISGYVGPKAFQALTAAGIAVYENMDGMTTGEALAKYRAGQCVQASFANHEAGV